MPKLYKYTILFLEIFLLIFFIWFTFYGGSIIGAHFKHGWFISEDGRNFINSALLFKESGIKIFFKSELTRQGSLNYILTIALIALIYDFQSWQDVFLSLNLTLFFFSYLLLKKCVIKNSLNEKKYFFLSFILLFFYFANYENYFYVRFILADCIFSFFVLLVFIKFSSFKRSNIDNYLIILITILIFFTNPKFIAILLFFIFYLLNKFLFIKNNFINKKFLGSFLLLAYFFGQLLWSIVYVNFDFMNNFKGDIFLEIKNFYLDGTIIYKKTNINYLPDEINIVKIFYLGILRSIGFFQFFSFEWDFKHNLVNTITILPLYLFNIMNIFNYNYYSRKKQKIIISILSMTIAFTFMVSITAVDDYWRYRYPLYTILMIGLIIFFSEKKFIIFK